MREPPQCRARLFFNQLSSGNITVSEHDVDNAMNLPAQADVGKPLLAAMGRSSSHRGFRPIVIARAYMKYRVQHQYRPKGSDRPLDYGQEFDLTGGPRTVSVAP
jgi:hypothetical protein